MKFGYTASCLKCRAMREGFQVTRGHSSLRRDRIMEALRNDEGSKDFLDKKRGEEPEVSCTASGGHRTSGKEGKAGSKQTGEEFELYT